MEQFRQTTDGAGAISETKDPIHFHGEVNILNGGFSDSISQYRYDSSSLRDPVAERRVRQTITAAASRNSQLLVELAATAQAPAELNNNQVKLDRLEARLAELKPEVEGVIAASKSQFKLHKSYRDSVGKKFIYTLLQKKGAIDERAAQEEETYHSVLEQRHKAEGKLTELNADRVALVSEIQRLETLAKRHAAVHKECDDLYALLFDGPTPGFPDEDEQEEKRQRAKAALEERTEGLKAVVGSVRAVQAIKLVIERASGSFEESKASLGNRSDVFSQRSVRASLKRCIAYIDRALELSDEALARISQPLPPTLEEARNTTNQHLRLSKIVAQGHLEKATKKKDAAAATAAAAAAASTERLSVSLAQALNAQKRYTEEIQTISAARRKAIRISARSFENERQALQQIRQNAFEITAGFGAAAPAYHECCDRAEAYVGESMAQCVDISGSIVVEVPDDEDGDGSLPPEYED